MHRAVAILAIISLFLGTISSVNALTWEHPAAGVDLMIGYALLLTLGVMTVTVQSARAMLGVDIGVLVCALVVRMPGFLVSLGLPQAGVSQRYATDEGALVDLAGKALRAGGNPYTATWAGGHLPTHVGVTPTMTGGVIDRFDYPPVSALLAAVSRVVMPSQPSAAIAGLVGLLAGTILLFILLPGPWKSAATMVCLGLGLYLMPLARQGYPDVMALPFVILAVNRWTRIGADGRLGLLGISSAIGLGLGCATHQTVWFLVPFLVVGLLLLRLGDLDPRTAWWVVGRYVAVVFGSFAAVNAPFAIENFHAWRTALLMPLLARTVPHGEGLVSLLYSAIGGSGSLELFGYASGVLAIAILACFVCFFRRLGPAATILPWIVFFVSIRSSDRYFYQMAPIWLMSLATVRPGDFARAKVVLGRHLPARVLAVVALFVPVAVLSVAAVASPQPLRMNVLSVTPSKSSYTKEIDVQVTNVSGSAIQPHFALSASVGMTPFWKIMMGPASLEPGQSGTYVLSPPVASARRSLLGPYILLRAMSGYPETMSSVRLPMLSTDSAPR
jgi:hypothetical protein